MGRGFVIEHCVSTLIASRKEQLYRYYVTEMLRVIAKSLGHEVRYSFYELVSDMEDAQEDERTSEEVIDGIRDKLARMGGD